MFCYCRRALLCPNINPNLNPIIPSLLLLLLKPFTSSKEKHSFTFNYLVNNCGLPPETASKLSNRVHLMNSDRPNSVLALFRSHGFSNAQLSRIIRIRPRLLSFDPNKTILPKFNFFLSKGASSSDLVHIITKNPHFLEQSLEKTITPCYDFVKRFLLSDKSTIQSIKNRVCWLYSNDTAHNIQVLLQNGVPESNVALLLRYWCYSAAAEHRAIFEKAVEEAKALGFKPNTTSFLVAVRAKMMSKSLWERKIHLYKKWGWSDEIVASAFVRDPWCMLASEDKIEAVMEFWVNHMGWESLMLAKYPPLLRLSLKKRIIPRAFVLQFLQSRGLIKDAKRSTPFKVSEKMFLQKFVSRFEEDASQLLKLYEEKKRSSKIAQLLKLAPKLATRPRLLNNDSIAKKITEPTSH